MADSRNSTPDLDMLRRKGAELRGQVVVMSHKAKAAHLASCMSCCDILAAAYWHVLNIDPTKPDDPLRDRFILSKGHAAGGLYAALSHRGFFPTEQLDTFCQDGGVLAEHPPANLLSGVEAATGSLGHGLPIGLGMAMAGRVRGEKFRVFALLGDGECNEGSNWEAAMFAAGFGLDNVCVVVDYNKWQATARSNETLALSPLKDKWQAAGWDTIEIDGHDMEALTSAMWNVPNGSGKPVAIIANTVKGKGVSFMEDDNNWHYRAPKAEEVEAAHKELGLL